MATQVAHLYITLCLARALFHAALLMGLPLAHLAPGAGPEGRLRRAALPHCALAALVFALQAGAMLVAAGFPGLAEDAAVGHWARVLVVALPLVGAVLDRLSRAAVDRGLWLPLDVTLLALSLAVVIT